MGTNEGINVVCQWQPDYANKYNFFCSNPPNNCIPKARPKKNEVYKII